MMKKIYNLLLLLFLFLLPWQTRYIWQYGELNKGFWEYGTSSLYGTEILLWMIILLFFFHHFVNKSFWTRLKEKRNQTILILMLFLMSVFFSTMLSKNFWVSYNYIFKLLEAMALMVVLAWQDEKTKYQIALWAGGILQGVLAIWQFLNQNVWASKWLGMAGQEAYNLGPSVIEFADQRWLRAYGSFGSPNSLGIYLAVLFVLGLVLYLKAESGRSKIIISAGQLFILSGLLLSFSRGAWVAATVGVASLFAIIFFKHHHHQSLSPLLGERQREGYSAYNDNRTDTPPLAPPLKGEGGRDATTALKEFTKQILFALAVIIFWLIIFYPVFTARFNLNNRLEAKSISERKDQYAEALSFIQTNPIFGIGPGAYTYASFKKYPTLASWQYQPIHNIYLLAIVEFGILSAFLFLLFIIYLFIKIYKTNLLFLPIITALLVAGLFDHWLASMSTGIIFLWVIIGLGFIDQNRQS